MVGRKISELVEVADFSSADVVVLADGQSAKITMKTISDRIKKDLGYMVRVLEKCKHCGQYGAVMCACPSCGAPIDPVE